MVQASYKYDESYWELPLPQEEAVLGTQRVRKIYRKKKNRRSMSVKIGLLMFCYALMLVFLCTKGSSENFKIVALEKDIASLEASNARLEYEIAQATNLGDVEKMASSELGMQKPDPKMAKVVSTPEVYQANQAVPVQTAAQDSAEQGILAKIYSALLTLAERNG
ncbi:MAG: hypothetical protein ABFD04_01570 [Syntrophomonas sp.]